MDKHEKEISIRVNGKDRPVTKMNGRHKDDHEIAAAVDESVDPPFEWMLPKEQETSNVYLFHANRNESRTEDEDLYSSERMPGLPIHRKKQRNLSNGKFPSSPTPFRIPKQFLIPIGSAVIIGCIIGLIVLMIFTGEEFKSQATQTVNPSAPAVQNPISSPTSSTVDVSISPYIVQGGLFSSLENAEQFAQTLKGNGYAAVVDSADNRVFIGVGGSMDEVNELAVELEGQVDGPYPYQWSLGGEVEIPEDMKLDWLTQGKELLVGSLASGSVADMRQELVSWEKKALESIAALNSDQQPKAVAWINALSSLPEVDGDQWVQQQAKLEVLMHYKQFIETFQ